MGRRERYLVIRCLPRTQTHLPRAEPPVTVGVDPQGRARGGGWGGTRSAQVPRKRLPAAPRRAAEQGE